jgi:hypothetical protein
MEPGEQSTRHDADSAIDPLAFLLASVPASEPVAGDSVSAGPSDGIAGLHIEAPAAVTSRSPLEPLAVVLAVVVAPLGLIAGIVASVLSRRRVGYVSGLARAAVIVAAIMCVVLAGGGVVYSFYAGSQAHEAALRASSTVMCAELATKPGILSDPAFGWPALSSTIPAYVSDVAAYQTWWARLTKVAPKQIRSQPAAIEKVAAANANRMAISRVVAHDQDYADIQKVASVSTLPQWVATYCAPK